MKSILVVFFFLYSFKNQAQIIDDAPIGTIVAYIGDPSMLINTDWAVCDGKPLLIKDYINLFDVIQWTYGYGNDVQERKYFSLPDLRGVFLRGVDMGKNIDPDANNRRSAINENILLGDRVGSMERDALQKHKHDDKGHIHTTNATVAAGQVDSDNSAEKAAPPNPTTATVNKGYADLSDPTDSETEGAYPVRVSNETRPVNISVYWIIKIK